MPTDDRPLLRKAAQGDADSLSALLRKHAPNVRASIVGRIPTRWQSLISEDDVMQQTYADAFMGISQFDPEGDGSFSGWLCNMAQCNLRDAIRMLSAVKRGGQVGRVELDDLAKPEAALVDLLTAGGASPSRCVAGKESESLLAHALGQLPPTYQLVVRMYDLEGHGVDTIACQLSRSPGAVYMLRARAHDALRKLLGATSDFFTSGA
jgi:RNA polymerase sigma factor (sigma-70 family)